MRLMGESKNVKEKLKYRPDDLDPKEEEKDQLSRADDDYEGEGDGDNRIYGPSDLGNYQEEDYKDKKGSLIKDIEKLKGRK